MHYNLVKGPFLGSPKTHSLSYGTNAVHFRGSLIWNNLPAVVKSSDKIKLKILEILIADV